MKIARILSTTGREFITTETSEEFLGKLRDVERIEIVEMKPEDVFMKPATSESDWFFRVHGRESTPDAELYRRLFDPSFPKTELEHYVARQLSRYERLVSAWRRGRGK